ncbi:hypothetical protein NLJ89_g6481 [Agrocybe chaxingu]|uniref:Uncharacterized protein n=1 Tax=Agrocybe chaxingu TaxID=84603 RepID=A0A9W8JY86_9AGAR|nr:hypothetical protein NLJ89_g6481 [Agrocybe chaxingu]
MPRPFVAHNVGRFRYDYAAAPTTTLDKSTAGDSKCEEGSHALGAQHGKLASYHGSPPRYHDAGASHSNPEARVHEIEAGLFMHPYILPNLLTSHQDLLHAVLSGSTVNSGHVHGSVKIVIDGPIYIGLRGPVDSEFRGHADIEIRGPIEVERCASTSSENSARQPTTRRSCSFPPDDQPAYTNSDGRSPSSRPAPTSTYEPAAESINSPRAPANFNPRRGESISTPCFRDDRCQAITLKGSQCKRNGKPNFCYQHVNKLITVPGFNTRTTKASQYVNFEDWIPSYLHPKTQARLRVEMEKTGSPSDVPGYIYVFEIKDLTEPEPDIIKLKVGYTKNLSRRLSQWNRQCRSQQHVLRGYYPEPEGEDATLLPGMLRPGVMVPWSHRLESLVHIELEDLASTFTYLTPGWQAMPAPGAPKEASPRDAHSRQRPSTTSSSIPEWRPIRRHQCQDCGVMHKEIFEFWRWTHGPNKGREWECLVRAIIERWAKFVKLYL